MQAANTIIGQTLAAEPDVLDGYVFGSVGRGTAGPMSDVDVAIYVSDAVSREGRAALQLRLASALMGALGRNDVDLVVLNEAPPLLYHRVLRDGIAVQMRDEAATTTREGRALSRYWDWVPVQARIDATLMRRLRRTDGPS